MASQAVAERPAIGDSIVRTPFDPGDGFPVFVQPRDIRLRDDPDAACAWFQDHRSEIDALLVEAGALVFRGFPVNDTAAFGRWFERHEAPRFGYTAGSSPRKQIAERVYESTYTPPQQIIMLHQEMAYLPVFPAQVAFYCRIPAASGGETLIADMRRVTAALEPAFVESVEERGILYTRNFRDREVSTGDPHLDVIHRSWQDAFDTTDREKPLADCRRMGLGAEWVDDGSLASTFHTRGLINHPHTGERLWFNQISTNVIGRESIGDQITAYEAYYGTSRPRPYKITYGDGGEIPADYIASLYAVLRRFTVAFPWSSGDILLVDNFLTAHGRNSYTGLRDVQVTLLS